ncbi:hypothetical protein BDA99DRAFT_546339 [Phascolomyces articulosus]|uniref:Uncharacterized protein n=1 Tax=Phascolomyces articulosus TaxID=60185 RepID=A0AAD5KKM6_9FUNG|nr:hypothetical protein BDA99DRAFT_546339 [Phascolomyces articulosus]
MAFLKATSGEHDYAMALGVLNTTYNIAKAQLDAAKKSSRISGYFSGYYNYFKRDSTSPTRTTTPTSPSSPDLSTPNGVLRAHVVKAECCLLIAVLQLLQESVMSYVKCGLNLRRAYTSYNFVWQKYKTMGDEAHKYMDRDTISGVQFGIGSVHLVLSALPAKIWKAVSILGWKPDKELGFKLLNECADNKRIRSPMATVMLLAYYTTAASFAPQILSEQYTKIGMETLLEAQRYYPNSALYLFFAGRTSRLALDLSLSTQSYLYAAEMTKNDWAEVAVASACRYEIAINHMITGNWEQAASSFEHLHNEKYWSPAFCKYMQGSCLEMTGNRSAAILAYAEVPSLVVKKLGGRMSDIDAYALRKVTLFQSSGYQDLDFYTPALEFMCIWNLFHFMDKAGLDYCLKVVNTALESIQIQEQEEYDKRSQELAPETSLPDHFDKRATLLLMKASLQNAKQVEAAENTIMLNWIIDHKENLDAETWVVPFALWEAGVACWHVNNRDRSRHVWEMALEFSTYDFEYRLAVRLNLAMTHAEELGYTKPIPKPTDDKKRYSVSLPAMAAKNNNTTANNTPPPTSPTAPTTTSS